MGYKLTVSSYGTWRSPISSALVASRAISLGQIAIDGEDIYWTEMRPTESGRHVIVHQLKNDQLDLIPPNFNARSRLHEYGGGAFTVADKIVYFSNFDDQRIYCTGPKNQPQPITPKGDFRYADSTVDRNRCRIICICEDHTDPGAEPTNSISSFNINGMEIPKAIVKGNDFYSSPRISPDGNHLAWITWNHPYMPWDETELWIGEFSSDGYIDMTYKIAGGFGESICQPEWSPAGALHFISDKTGWWNLYKLGSNGVEALTELEAEFGRPHWVFKNSTYAFVSENRIICAYAMSGIWHLADLDTISKNLKTIETPFSEISYLNANSSYAVFIGGSMYEPTSVVLLDLHSKSIKVLKKSTNIIVDSEYISIPEIIKFPTAYAFYYSPKNKDFNPPPNEKPPLIVISHGGPTSAATTSLNLTTQYWTSRGFAVLIVNYRGSTGYGRDFRDKLLGQWGISDVEDCLNGALYLIELNKVDGKRLIIRGASAGGFTALNALTSGNVFKAGSSYYGVSDLEALRKETHKFESRYLDRLIGAYPEQKDLYHSRSPINSINGLSCPIIFFQGLDDRIVPPNQAREMFEALRSKGITISYLEFEGEQHGFRKAENIKRALDAELYFYSRIFDFDIPDFITPIAIENLKVENNQSKANADVWRK